MENKNGNLLMAPLWLMYPEIPNGSIGWRMGYGEGYAIDFYLWFNKLEEDEKKKYKEMFPEPKRWKEKIIFMNTIIIGHTLGKKMASLNMI